MGLFSVIPLYFIIFMVFIPLYFIKNRAVIPLYFIIFELFIRKRIRDASIYTSSNPQLRA